MSAKLLKKVPNGADGCLSAPSLVVVVPSVVTLVATTMVVMGTITVELVHLMGSEYETLLGAFDKDIENFKKRVGQMVSYIFFKFIAIFIFIGIQTTLFGHSNEQNPVCHFTYISVPSHCSHL